MDTTHLWPSPVKGSLFTPPIPVEQNPSAIDEAPAEAADPKIEGMRKKLMDIRAKAGDRMSTKDCCPDMTKCSHMAKAELKAGQSYRDLEKARADEGKDLHDKVRARQERNARSVEETKTPSGQKTRTYRSSRRRENELEVGDRERLSNPDAQGRPMRAQMIPAERRLGEKIVGEQKDLVNSAGVHMRSGDYARNAPITSTAPVAADKNGKTYRTPHPFGPQSAHADVMDAQRKIQPKLTKGMTYKELQKMEQLSKDKASDKPFNINETQPKAKSAKKIKKSEVDELADKVRSALSQIKAPNKGE